MPDDRPLSKDLPVGTKLRREGTVHIWTIQERGSAADGWWLRSQVDNRHTALTDTWFDATSTPWSILPSDEPPAPATCTHGPMCQWCKPTGPALPSDEEAEPPPKCTMCGAGLAEEERDRINPVCVPCWRSLLSEPLELDQVDQERVARLEAVVEAARALPKTPFGSYYRWSTDGDAKAGEVLDAYRAAQHRLRDALASLDTSVVVPDADGGR